MKKENSHDIYLYLAAKDTDIFSNGIHNSTNTDNKEGRSLKQNETSKSIKFGATASPNASCPENKICKGKSIPSVNKVPYFFITCGNKTYIGPDRYYFAPTYDDGNDNHFIRPYFYALENLQT